MQRTKNLIATKGAKHYDCCASLYIAKSAMSLDVDVLEHSFNQLKPNAAEFASSFYNTLFADYPDAQALFIRTDMATQQRMLLNALVFVVENLRNPDVLSKQLQDLGARHAGYGALPDHYPLVGMTLIKTMKSYLGDQWTPQVEQAWLDGYEAIAQLMLKGTDADR
jgi:hemoglobin-like flavoprotein